MARGEQELYCLNFIKEHLESDSMFYGMSKEDCDRIEKMILSAVPNPRSSEFPDFICDGGFIEHFQISSGKTTKKGSLHKQNEAKFNNDYETGLEEFKAKIDEEPIVGVCRSYSLDMEYKEHSYENLVCSMEKTFEHHIDSMHKYNNGANIGAFLIEYSEMALSMIEDCYTEMNGLKVGDLHKQEHFSDYRLSRDKNMLDFIYKYRQEIQYIVYLSRTSVEIISVENIPKLKSLLPWEYRIAAMHMVEHRAAYTISVPDEK